MNALTKTLLCLMSAIPSVYATSVVGGDTSGNARGADSIDIQSQRGMPTNVASGTGSVAVGLWNSAGGTNSVSFGLANHVTAEMGLAFGVGNSVYGPLQYFEQPPGAFGLYNTINQNSDGSYAFGRGNSISAAYATVFGNSITNSTADSTMIGPSDSAKVTILSNGNVGIGLGSSSPAARLDVGGGDIRLSGNIVKAGGGTVVLPTSGTLTLPAAGGSLVTTSGTQTITGTTTLGGAVPAAQVVVDSTGKVGIGTNNLTSKLTVIASGSLDTGVSSDREQQVVFVGPNKTVVNGVNSGQVGIFANDAGPLADAGGSIALGAVYNTSNHMAMNAAIKSGRDNATNGNYGGYLSLYTRPNGNVAAERVRITSAGNVGVGTTTPSAKLQTQTATNGLNFGLGLLNGSTVETGGTAVGIGFLNETTAPADWWKAAIVHERKGSYGVGSLHFLVNNQTTNAQTTLADARMTITKEGTVGIGTTTPDTSVKLEVAGNVKFSGISTATGTLTLPTGGGALVTTTGTQTLTNKTLDGSYLSGTTRFNSSGTANATLNLAKVQYINSTIDNLGYSSTTATPLTQLKVDPTISNFRVVTTGASIFVMGTFYKSEVMVGGTTIYAPIPGVPTGFVAKFVQNSSSPAWIKRISHTYSVADCVEDGAGNVYFGGSINASAGTSISVADSAITSTGGEQGFALKLNTSGQLQWNKTFRSNAASGGAKITGFVFDTSGNLFVSGTLPLTSSNQGAVLANLSVPASDLVANYNGFVARMASTDGALSWYKIMYPTTGNVEMKADRSGGGIYVYGLTQSTVGGAIKVASVSSTSAGSSDPYIARIQSAGTVDWVKTIGAANSDYIRDLEVDSAGDIYAVGSIWGSIGQSINVAGSSLLSRGAWDGYLVKISKTGTTQYAKAYGSTNSDGLITVSICDQEGVVRVGGAFNPGSSPGAPVDLGGASAVSAGGEDGFVAACTLAGTLPYVTTFGAAGTEQVTDIRAVWTATGLSLAVSGNSYVSAGQSLTLNGFNFGITQLDANGFVWGYNVQGQVWGRLIGSNWPRMQNRNDIPAEGLVLTGMAGNGFTLGDEVVSSGPYVIMSWADQWGDFISTPADAPASSMAWGNSNAGGSAAVAMGQASIANGTGSTAFGSYTTASSDYSFAGGQYSTASGYGATSLGVGNNAVGRGAFAAGEGVSAGDHAVSLGAWSSADGAYSVALGSGNYAWGYGSIAIGSGGENWVSGTSAVAIGTNLAADALSVTVVGNLNVPQGNTSAWVPTDDLFVVGNGNPNDWTQSNALVVHKNGNTRVAGTVEAKGGFRTRPMGDIDMGGFTAGPNPGGRNPEDLNEGLRYANE